MIYDLPSLSIFLSTLLFNKLLSLLHVTNNPILIKAHFYFSEDPQLEIHKSDFESDASRSRIMSPLINSSWHTEIQIVEMP